MQDIVDKEKAYQALTSPLWSIIIAINLDIINMNAQEKKANYAKVQEEMLWMEHVENKQEEKEEVWFLNSRCNNHICGKKELFSYLDKNSKETLKLGNNTSMDVKGKGNIIFHLNRIS